MNIFFLATFKEFVLNLPINVFRQTHELQVHHLNDFDE